MDPKHFRIALFDCERGELIAWSARMDYVTAAAIAFEMSCNGVHRQVCPTTRSLDLWWKQCTRIGTLMTSAGCVQTRFVDAPQLDREPMPPPPKCVAWPPAQILLSIAALARLVAGYFIGNKLARKPRP